MKCNKLNYNPLFVLLWVNTNSDTNDDKYFNQKVLKKGQVFNEHY